MILKAYFELSRTLASKHEETSFINNLISYSENNVFSTLIDFFATAFNFESVDGGITNLLNINNIERDYEIVDIPLNDIYPRQVLPVEIKEQGTYDDDILVNLEQLQSAKDRIRSTFPTSTLYNKYQQAGYDSTNTINKAHSDFLFSNNQSAELNILPSLDTDIQGIDEVQDELLQIEAVVSYIKSIINLINYRNTTYKNQARILYSYTFLVERDLNLNEVFDPLTIPVDVSGDTIYEDDYDIFVERFQNIFESITYENTLLPSLIRKYRSELGLDILSSIEKVRDDNKFVVNRNNEHEPRKIEKEDIISISQKIDLLRQETSFYLNRSNELLYRQQAAINQFSKTIELVFEARTKLLEQRIEKEGLNEEEALNLIQETYNELQNQIEQNREDAEEATMVLQSTLGELDTTSSTSTLESIETPEEQEEEVFIDPTPDLIVGQEVIPAQELPEDVSEDDARARAEAALQEAQAAESARLSTITAIANAIGQDSAGAYDSVSVSYTTYSIQVGPSQDLALSFFGSNAVSVSVFASSEQYYFLVGFITFETFSFATEEDYNAFQSAIANL